MSVQHDLVAERLVEQIEKPIAELLEPSGRLRQRLPRDLARLAQSDDVRHILGSRAAARFVAGAVDERFELYALANIKNSDAFRSIELVPGDGQQVDAQLFYIDGDFAKRLGRVGVHERAARLGDVRDVTDGL